MSEPIFELSSISSGLEELTQRLADIADQLSHLGQNEIAYELFEVERSLGSGLRRLAKIVNRSIP